jgi:hypothetical protein
MAEVVEVRGETVLLEPASLLELVLAATEPAVARRGRRKGEGRRKGSYNVNAPITVSYRSGRLFFRFSEEVAQQIACSAGMQIELIQWDDGEFLIGGVGEGDRGYTLAVLPNGRDLMASFPPEPWFPTIHRQTAIEIVDVIPPEYEGDTGVFTLRVK